jgi:DNA gyrase subunit A
MVSELKALKKRYATPRRTRLVEGGDALVAQKAAAVRPNVELQRQQARQALGSDSRLLIQADGLVRIVSPAQLGRLHLEEAADLGEQAAPARLILPTAAAPTVLAFSTDGRVAPLRWEFAGQQPGSLERFLPESLSGASVAQIVVLPQGDGLSLGLLSSDGRFKRLPLEEFQELSSRASTVLRLKEGVSLRRVVVCREEQDLVVASSSGRLLRLAVNEANLPLMGRTAQGPMLLRLLPDEEVVGAACGNADSSVLLVSRTGRVKRLRLDGLRLCQRGDLGQIGLRLPDRSDRLVDLCGDGSPLIGVRLAGTDGRSLRLGLADLPSQDAAGEGQDLPLATGDAVRELVPLISG